MSDITQQIVTALGLLDPANDEHWTSDGMPRVSVIEELTGVKGLKRGDITGAAPNFTRENVHVQPGGGDKPPVEGADNGLGEDLDADKDDGDHPAGDDPKDDADAGAESGSHPGAPGPDASAPAPAPAAEVPTAEAVAGTWADMDVKDRLQSCREELALQNDILSRAKGEIEFLHRMEQELISEHDAKYPPMSQAELVKAVHKAQREAKAVRVSLTGEAHAALRAKGVKPSFPPIPRSPLDQAMARRTGYGHDRPTFQGK